MVGDHQIDPALAKIGDLVFCRDTVVDRDDKRGSARVDEAVERGSRKSVTFIETVRYEGVNISPQSTQGLGKQAC